MQCILLSEEDFVLQDFLLHIKKYTQMIANLHKKSNLNGNSWMMSKLMSFLELPSRTKDVHV